MKIICIVLAMFASVACMQAEVKEATPVYRHVVLFQYKKSATTEQVDQATKRFKALKDAIPEIAGFEWGKQCSPEGLDEGVTHCYLLTFKDKKDFLVYLKHAKHEAFVKTIKPLVEKPIVVDFVSEP